MMDERIFLAGDIGGTKTNLIAFSPGSGPTRPLAQASFASADYAGLGNLAKQFLTNLPHRVERACFGVAGPVINGCSQITNLPWLLDEKHLSLELDIETVLLVNDLTATAASIPNLRKEDIKQIKTGTSNPHGQVAVIAPGTGLGEAFLAWDGSRYRAYASEGGHVNFAPSSVLEIELLTFLLKTTGQVSYEDVCSGIGLPNIYAFLRANGHATSEDLDRQLAEADDPTPLIIQKAKDKTSACELCKKSLQLFVSILGAEAGNLALKFMATGGVYLGGGIPPRIIAELDSDNFRSSFANKGKMAPLVNSIPVYVIMNPRAPLIGAASILINMQGKNG